MTKKSSEAIFSSEAGRGSPRREAIFLKAARCERTPRTPVWLMRQAGRSMPSYRKLREKVPFLELCKQPDKAARVAVQAASELEVDAAILFSDLLLPLEPMGFSLHYERTHGPMVADERGLRRDPACIPEIDPERDLAYVGEAVRATRAMLPAGIPLIGFAGGPFTMAVYMLEADGPPDLARVRSMMGQGTSAWEDLLTKITRTLVRFLRMQIEAGADAVQIFDTWAGSVEPGDYRTRILPYVRALVRDLHAEVPVIYFGLGLSEVLADIAATGVQGIGVDSQIALKKAWQRVGPKTAVQGNLDPAVLVGPLPELRRQVRDILDQAAGRPGHIFNLGHGVLPQTPFENVRALVNYVRELSAQEQRA
ncbi:MAG: uroporphyrinogen decarboxylase [Candidatus Omnitrophota bacterium]